MRQPNNNVRLNTMIDDISSIFTNIENINRTDVDDSDLQIYINNITNLLNSPIIRNHMSQNIPSNLEPVIVRPTSDQIRNACESLSFHMIENPLNSNCPILVEPFQPNDIVTRIIYCGHCFNPPSLQRWFSANVRCPVCRYDIRNFNHNTHRQSDRPIPSTETSSQENIPHMIGPAVDASLNIVPAVDASLNIVPAVDASLNIVPAVDVSFNILYTGFYYYNQPENNDEPEI